MDMLCMMFHSEERGVLVSGNVPWSDSEIAEAVRGDHAECLRDIQLLLEKGVAVRDSRGCIFSKRMVRDEQERKADKARKRQKRNEVSGNCPVDVRSTFRPLAEDETATEFAVEVDSKKPMPTDELTTRETAAKRVMEVCQLSGYFEKCILQQLQTFSNGNPVRVAAETMAKAIRRYGDMGGDKLYFWLCEGGWLKDESTWFGGKCGEPSKAKQRQQSNREVIVAAARNRYSGNAGSGSGEDGQGTDGGGDGGLVRIARKAAGARD